MEQGIVRCGLCGQWDHPGNHKDRCAGSTAPGWEPSAADPDLEALFQEFLDAVWPTHDYWMLDRENLVARIKARGFEFQERLHPDRRM